MTGELHAGMEKNFYYDFYQHSMMVTQVILRFIRWYSLDFVSLFLEDTYKYLNLSKRRSSIRWILEA
jgi:hypothetical protein